MGCPAQTTGLFSNCTPDLGWGWGSVPVTHRAAVCPGGEMETHGLNMHQALFHHALMVILEAFSSDMLGVMRGFTQPAGLRFRGVWRRSAK